MLWPGVFQKKSIVRRNLICLKTLCRIFTSITWHYMQLCQLYHHDENVRSCFIPLRLFQKNSTPTVRDDSSIFPSPMVRQSATRLDQTFAASKGRQLCLSLHRKWRWHQRKFVLKFRCIRKGDRACKGEDRTVSVGEGQRRGNNQGRPGITLHSCPFGFGAQPQPQNLSLPRVLWLYRSSTALSSLSSNLHPIPWIVFGWQFFICVQQTQRCDSNG